MRRLSEKKVANETGYDTPKKPNGTDWDRILMAAFLSFLSSFQFSPLLVILWPYIKQIDDAITVAFYGIVVAAFQSSFASFSVIFSIWSCEAQKFRWPLLAGRSTAVLSCLLYLAVEYADSGRRFCFLVLYFLFGIAEGSSSVLSIYARCFAAEKDYQMAKNAVTIGYTVGFIFGPVVSVAFSPLKYPSVPLFLSKILVNAYTCPIWISLSINILSMTVICVLFEDFEIKKATRELINMYSIKYIRERFVSLRSLKITCLGRCHVMCGVLVRVVAELNYATFMTLTAPILTISFGLSGELTTLFFSICVILSMALSFGVRAVVETRFWNKLQAREKFFTLVAAVDILAILPLSIFALDGACFRPETHNIRNGFCDENATLLFGTYMFVYMMAMGIVLPLVKLQAEKVYYQKRKLKQTLFKVCVPISRQLSLILTPLYACFMFSTGLPHILWLINSFITLVSMIFLFWTGVKRDTRAKTPAKKN